MHPIAILIIEIINLFSLLLFVWVIIGLLVHFNIINAYQPLVKKITYILDRIIDPVLRPIRQFIPAVGGIDLSPIVLLLGLQFIQNMIIYYS